MATNNLDAIEAQIQKIKEQTQEISRQVPGAVSAAPENKNNIEAIPVSSLQSTPSLIELPQKKQDTTNYSRIINDGAILSKIYGGNEQQDDEKTASGLFDQYLGAMTANEPKDLTGEYESTYSGLENKQKAAITSKKNLEMLNAQLQGISDTSTAQNLELEKQALAGGMNSPLFLNRQQAENSRQAAIASLPLQAKILAAQAQYNADKDTLLAAQDKVDKLFDIKSRYEEQRQDYNQRLINSVFDYASKEQQAALEEKANYDKQVYEEKQNKLKAVREYAKMAIQNGQGTIAGYLMELDADDPEFQSKLAQYTAKVKITDNARQLISQAISGNMWNTMSDSQRQSLWQSAGYEGVPVKAEDEKKTTVVEVDGRKFLIDSQTGDRISDLGSSGTIPTGTVKSGGLTISGDDVTAGQIKLNQSRSTDGYSDTNTYISMFNLWLQNGGLADDFFKYYSPTDYINPNDTSVPSYIRNKIKKQSGSSTELDYLTQALGID